MIAARSATRYERRLHLCAERPMARWRWLSWEPSLGGSGGTSADLCRGSPIRAGWNSTADTSVQASDKASSLPMLDVPGWCESHRLPNAVAVRSALKKTARVSADAGKASVRCATPGCNRS